MSRTRGALRALLATACITLPAGCGSSSFTPTNDQRYSPPAEYRRWFDETQACSGLEGNFDRIKWFVVPGTEFNCPGGTCVGRWDADHSIFIAGDWVDSEMVVRHEILHDLIGHPGHPDPPFGNPCPLTWESWRGDSSATTASARVVALPRPNID